MKINKSLLKKESQLLVKEFLKYDIMSFDYTIPTTNIIISLYSGGETSLVIGYDVGKIFINKEDRLVTIKKGWLGKSFVNDALKDEILITILQAVIYLRTQFEIANKTNKPISIKQIYKKRLTYIT